MATSKKIKILIVEDDLPLLKALIDKFEKENFEVSQAHNGEDGLIAAHVDLPDVILLDIVMPKMDGITMLTKMRATDWGKSIPVLLLTNLSDNEVVADAMVRGVYDYLVKSDWKLEDVVKRVKQKVGLIKDIR